MDTQRTCESRLPSSQGKCSDPTVGVSTMISWYPRGWRWKSWIQDMSEHGLHGHDLMTPCVTCFTSWTTYLIREEQSRRKPKTPLSSLRSSCKQLCIKKTYCVILTYDFRGRSQDTQSDRWSMTKHENKGYDNKILDLMWTHDLCASDTYFKSKCTKLSDRYTIQTLQRDDLHAERHRAQTNQTELPMCQQSMGKHGHEYRDEMDAINPQIWS